MTALLKQIFYKKIWNAAYKYKYNKRSKIDLLNISNRFLGDRREENGSKVAPVIVETTAGPTRVFAPQPDNFKNRLTLPEVNPEWTDFYKNVNAALEGKAELIVKPA